MKSHSLAGGNCDGLAGAWIPPLTGRTRRYVENAKSGNTDRLAG